MAWLYQNNASISEVTNRQCIWWFFHQLPTDFKNLNQTLQRVEVSVISLTVLRKISNQLWLNNVLVIISIPKGWAKVQQLHSAIQQIHCWTTNTWFLIWPSLDGSWEHHAEERHSSELTESWLQNISLKVNRISGLSQSYTWRCLSSVFCSAATSLNEWLYVQQLVKNHAIPI